MSLHAWLALALVAPLVLLTPGYLLLRGLHAHQDRRVAEGSAETLALSAVTSMAIVIVVAFTLSQTVGLTRLTLTLAGLALLAGLGWWVARAEDGPPWPSPARPSRGSVSLSAVLVGLTLAIVAAGGLLYDGSQPYTEVRYADAEDVPAHATVGPGERLDWGILVDNHEGETTTYTLETVRVPNVTTNGSPGNVTIERTELTIVDGETHRYRLAFQAPEEGTWRVLTRVHADGKAQPLSVHRWIEVDA